MTFQKRRIAWALAAILGFMAFGQNASAQVYTRFGPVTGILKGNVNTYQTTGALSADVIALWTGTCNATTFLRADGSCIAAGGGGGGSVTSVALTVPSGFSVTGSPITTAGTLGITGILNPAAGGIGVGTLTGVAKGNGTSAFTAAASSDVISLWTGTCNATTFLRADGSCQVAAAVSGANPSATAGITAVNGVATTYLRSDGAPAISQAIVPTWSGVHTFNALPLLYPTNAVETAASVTPVKSYVYGDPRRNAGFYTSAGWTDFGDVPTYVDATHFTVPGDQTARYLPFMQIAALGTATRIQCRVIDAAFSAVTTVHVVCPYGGTMPTTLIALWAQTSLVANGVWGSIININTAAGAEISNASQGTTAAARYSAYTLDAAGLPTSAVFLLAVSPTYSGAYLGGGFTSGQRAVLYTPPSSTLEIGTSDVARILLNTTTMVTRLPQLGQDGTAANPAWSFESDPDTGFFRSGANESRMVTGGTARMIFSDTAVFARVPVQSANGSAAAPSQTFENGATNGQYHISSSSYGLAANGVNQATISSGGLLVGAPTGSTQGSGTLNATGLFVQGVAVCRSNGTNCPAGSTAPAFAVISVSGAACTISAAYDSSGVSACTYNSAGSYTVTFSTASTVRPACTVTPFGAMNREANVSGGSSTTIAVQISSLTSTGPITFTATDSSFAINCMRQ